MMKIAFMPEMTTVCTALAEKNRLVNECGFPICVGFFFSSSSSAQLDSIRLDRVVCVRVNYPKRIWLCVLGSTQYATIQWLCELPERLWSVQSARKPPPLHTPIRKCVSLLLCARFGKHQSRYFLFLHIFLSLSFVLEKNMAQFFCSRARSMFFFCCCRWKSDRERETWHSYLRVFAWFTYSYSALCAVATKRWKNCVVQFILFRIRYAIIRASATTASTLHAFITVHMWEWWFLALTLAFALLHTATSALPAHHLRNVHFECKIPVAPFADAFLERWIADRGKDFVM